MGLSASKVEDDKVLALCQERKRFVREALDGICAFSASHFAYILSLRETGYLLRKCFEHEALKASIPNAWPSILHVNHMDAGRDSMKAIEEVSVPVIVTTRASFHAVKEASDSCSDNSKHERRVIDSSTNEKYESLAVTSADVAQSSTDVLPTNRESKKHYPDVSNVVKDLNSFIKEIEISFSRASNSGKEVPRILEEDKFQFHPLLPEEIEHGSESPSFLATLFACCREDVTVPESPPRAEIKYQYLTWHRSVSSQLSPSRIHLGMYAGSHISTLHRLYAWESKLYDEVKASSAICRSYDEKCKKLRHQELRKDNQISIDFTRATVKDLHSRILVSVQKIDFISKNIEDLRDKDLQPQLDELIGCLTRMWTTMLECHQRQCVIIKLVSRSCSLTISSQSESQCQAALLLSMGLRKLRSNFRNWMASHKAYLCSLNLWLHKCMRPLKRRKSSRMLSFDDVSLTGCAVAPIFTTCEIWIKLLDDLPTRDLEEAIEGLIGGISHYIPHEDNMANDDGTGGEILTSYAPADIQLSLSRLLEKLETFSEISLQRYIDLQKHISAAKERIWRKD